MRTLGPMLSGVGTSLLTAVFALTACSGSDDVPESAATAVLDAGAQPTEPIGVDASAAETEVQPVAADEPSGVPIETSDPNVISRRTEGLEVLVLPEGVELPPGYTQAAVPVDAFAASEMTVTTPTGPPPPMAPKIPAEAFDNGPPVVSGDSMDVTASILSCRLVAVWVLPHPNEIVVGYEDYPELACVVPLDHSVTFRIPITGTNSEGSWDYAQPPPIVPLRKVGATD